jgi:hypothetical protein
VPVSANGVVLGSARSDVSVVSGVVGQGVVSLSTSQTGAGRTVSSLSVLVASSQTRVVVVVVTSQARADTSSGEARGETSASVGGTGETGTMLVVVSVVEVTSNGLGGSTSGGEVGSRVLEGLSASRADERDKPKVSMAFSRRARNIANSLVQSTRRKGGRGVERIALLVGTNGTGGGVVEVVVIVRHCECDGLFVCLVWLWRRKGEIE